MFFLFPLVGLSQPCIISVVSLAKACILTIKLLYLAQLSNHFFKAKILILKLMVITIDTVSAQIGHLSPHLHFPSYYS